MDGSDFPSGELPDSHSGPNVLTNSSFDWSNIFSNPSETSEFTGRPVPFQSPASLSSLSSLSSKNPFRKPTSSTQRLTPIQIPTSSNPPVAADSEAEIASLEAEELQVKLRLIQLRKQQLLGGRNNTRPTVTQTTSHPGLNDVSNGPAQIQSQVPTHWLPVDEIQTQPPTYPSPTFASPKQIIGKTDPLPSQHGHSVNDNSESQHELKIPQDSGVGGSRIESQPYGNAQKSQNIDGLGQGNFAHVSDLGQVTRINESEQRLELSFGVDRKALGLATYGGHDSFSTRDFPKPTETNPSHAEIQSANVPAFDRSHYPYQEPESVNPEDPSPQYIRRLSSPDNLGNESRALSNHKPRHALNYKSHGDNVDYSAFMTDPMTSPSTETQILDSDESRSLNTSTTSTSVAQTASPKPESLNDKHMGRPLLESKDPPPKQDEELALEVAEEEALTFLQNGQLEDLHPALQEQLAVAMKAHMPNPAIAASLDHEDPQQSYKHRLTKSMNPLQRLQYDEGSQADISSNNSLPYISKSESSGNAQSHDLSRGDSKTTSMARKDRFGAGFKAARRHELDQFEVMEDASPTAAQEGDTCDCGKAQLAVDECYFCWPCDGTIFCKECWDRCPPHKKRRLGMAHTAGLPHEKSDPFVARKIFDTLQAEHSIEQQALLHVQDEDTSWFGTGEDEGTGEFVFQDFGRYPRLMAETSTQHRRIRYPALVSFVGQTGAGKSSLIRLLIQACAPDNVQPQVPVVGSTLHADLPTSGDVHLYADMKTIHGNQPVLYADCEGLDGGERQPMGARSRNKDKNANMSNDRTHSFTKHIRRQHHTSEREISWANTALTRSREYHVRHLYPRLLYTFSDVIVFVMKNPRVIENTIEQLLRWAAAALETSSNQPVLPNAIIVLNAFENSSDASLWDVDNSTNDLMEKVRRAVYQNHGLRKFADFWRERGKSIENVETLLLSYYSSVRVVRVPERGRPTLINDQVRKLYHEVQEACDRSRRSKHQVRMLLNSDEMQPYLQYAFDHFSRNLDQPFDFVQASLSNNPIPSNFGGNVLKLAIDVMDLWKDKLDGPRIFKELSFMVASCIMLDSARHRTLGPAEKVMAAYVHYCDDALEKFCNRHCPCEYVHPYTQGRCVNVKVGHQSKGHQLKNGKVLAVGSFESDFTPERYQEFFQYCVMWNLKNLLDRLQEATSDHLHLELQKAAEIHRDISLYPFFHHLQGPQSFISHTACYSCLIAPPEHALPCGHVLCSPCIQAYGTSRGRCIVEMSYCPLHHRDPEGQFHIRWPVFIKPPGAGIRIMSLDGGGVRGIVELTILQQIEMALGTGLPIQAFFDLIIGTSTGGIISLGLGAHGWTVRQCIRHFEALCHKAFTKRKGIGIPGLEHIISFSNHSRYETTPIESALQRAFSAEQNLFAGPREALEDQAALQRLTKVGVTTVTTAGTVALLANYNRVDEEEGQLYQFHRSEKPSTEIKTWEAARATSAAPTMFKPFAHDATGQVYQDGALYYNCPVELAMREQRLIWPDMADSCPDVILSIGTGINEVRRKAVPKGKALRLGVFSQLKNLTKIAIDSIKSSMNSEQTWKNFVQQSNPPSHLRDRYVRLNLRMTSDPPKMDEVSQLTHLKTATLLQFAPNEARIKSVADRLLATSFYFSLDLEPFTAENDGGISIVSGFIHCRFAPHSSEIRSLGEALRRRSRNAYNQNYSQHNPYFVVQERRKELKARQIVLSTDTVDRMISDGIFFTERVQIPQINNRVETDILFCFGDQPERPVMYPISGFPRCFMEELDKVSRPKLATPSQTKAPATLNLSWAAFEAKKSSWKFDAARFLRSKDPFQYYSSPEYVNPGNATTDLMETLSSRFSGNSRIVTDILATSNTTRDSGEEPRVELSTERELREDLGDPDPKLPTSDAETIRTQLLRLLLSRSSIVTGPPRLDVTNNPILLHPGFAEARPKPAMKTFDKIYELPTEKPQRRRSSKQDRLDTFAFPWLVGTRQDHQESESVDTSSSGERDGQGNRQETRRRFSFESVVNQ